MTNNMFLSESMGPGQSILSVRSDCLGGVCDLASHCQQITTPTQIKNRYVVIFVFGKKFNPNKKAST